MTKIIITNYDLRADKVIAFVSDGQNDCEYGIDRAEYEDWLTDGTGLVDMGFTHHDGNVLTEVEIKEPIPDYWQQGEEINSQLIIEHLQLYLTKDELTRCSVRAELLEQHLKDLFYDMEAVKQADACSTLIEYGMLNKEAGEQSAGIVFRKILSEQRFGRI